MDHNRRKNHLFGFTFDISVKWLIVIIVMGIFQFGVFYKQFVELSEDLEDIKDSIKDGVSVAQNLFIKDAQQDARIMELERRLNTRERSGERTNGSRP